MNEVASESTGGEPVVIQTEHGITINVPKSDIRVPVEIRPGPVETHVHVDTFRRDLLLAVLAAAVVVDVLVRLFGGG